MKKRLRHLMAATACTLVALLVLSSATQVGAVVVCVGLDGHIDIESLLEGCCISGTSGPRSRTAELAPAGSTCGDCTDVQLKASPFKSKESHLYQPDLGAGCTICSTCSSSGRTFRTPDVVDMDQHWPSFKPLTSVFLLT